MENIDFDFLPEDYKLPTWNSDKYCKFWEGTTRIRILEKPVIGWRYFNTENIPFMSKEKPTTTPWIKEESKLKEFWAMVIWNYEISKIQILQIDQNWIKSSILEYAKDPDWGSPKNYDLKITKTGQKLETKYSVIPGKIAEITEEIEQLYNETFINLNALFEWKDPFEMPKL